jgi:hypothetical protein
MRWGEVTSGANPASRQQATTRRRPGRDSRVRCGAGARPMALVRRWPCSAPAAAPCTWSYDCWPTTANTGSPATSTPTCATRRIPGHHPRNHPARHQRHHHLHPTRDHRAPEPARQPQDQPSPHPCSSKRSTPARHACPATPGPSPTHSPQHDPLKQRQRPNFRRSESGSWTRLNRSSNRRP